MYNFKEAQLGLDFAKEKQAEFKSLINSSISFTVISMPGVGVSYFLKYLSCQDFVYFIYVDLYTLPSLNKHEFYRMFLREIGGNPSGKSDEQVFIDTKEILKKLATSHPKVVIIFSRFDALKKEFDENFLSNLQGLTGIVPDKIVLIFTAIKPIYELTPDAVTGGNLTFYSKILYFKPFNSSDLKKLFLLEHTQKAHANLDELIKQSGGHNQLLHIFMNSHKQNNLLLDKFVTLQLKDLLSYLDYQQKKQVTKIALGKIVDDIDEYLLEVGYINQTKKGFSIFSPILAEYVKTNMPHKLPAKEAKLFKLLRKNMGRVTSKDEIFTDVWPARNASRSEAGGDDQPEMATDWALDALIYRLRKHPFIISSGYIIESHKKVGYTLIHS